MGTKYLFQVLAQLSENFIFIYLGLSLFTMTELVFKPTIIVITTVLPLSFLVFFNCSSLSAQPDGARYSRHHTLSTLSLAIAKEARGSNQMKTKFLNPTK